MTRSMTGFGRATISRPAWTLTWEIASRNARYLELKWKTPPGWTALHQQWDALVRRTAQRGTIELSLSVRLLDPELAGNALDTLQAQAMVESLRRLALELGVPQPQDISPLLAVPSIWRESRGEDVSPIMAADATDALTQALQHWDASRCREGIALEQDLDRRLTTLGALCEGITAEVRSLAPQRMASLQERLRALLGEESVPDPARLHLELALLADKVDVSEELTRLQAHLASMETILRSPGPKGRKLDFLVQEVLREITTCSNKVQSASVSALAVDFKTELEKVREQIQNLE